MFGVPPGAPASSASTSAPSAAHSRRSSLLSSAPSSSYSAPRRPPFRQAQVAEQVDLEGELETEVDEPASLEEVLQTEVQNLAEEIAEAEEEGIDPLHLESLEQGIEASAEALVSMREARVKLAEMRKDRGFRGPPSGGGAQGARKRVGSDRCQEGQWETRMLRLRPSWTLGRRRCLHEARPRIGPPEAESWSGEACEVDRGCPRARGDPGRGEGDPGGAHDFGFVLPSGFEARLGIVIGPRGGGARYNGCPWTVC